MIKKKYQVVKTFKEHNDTELHKLLYYMFLNRQMNLSSIYSLYCTLINVITTYLYKLQYLMSILSEPVLEKLSQSVQETKK